jgi:gluconate 2-dehydrogenase gamma chain
MKRDMKRRDFLTIPAAAIGGTLLYTLGGEAFRLQAQSAAKDGTVKVPLRFFTAEEARQVSAVCARIFPSDASGPGATEAAVVIYIDRQLAGPYGRDKYRYTKGPFVESMPEHGYQGKDSPRDIYRAGIKVLGDFASLSPTDQDAKLTSIETSRFFQLVRTHTIEGMFSDPMHGGNAGLIGWQLIGFPGPQMSYRNEIDKHYGQPFRPKPASLQQITRRTVQPWEDEKD